MLEGKRITFGGPGIEAEKHPGLDLPFGSEGEQLLLDELEVALPERFRHGRVLFRDEVRAFFRDKYPELQVDGEMHVLSALNPALRDTVYPNANLKGRANILVMPNLDAANIAMGLIRSMTDALLIGPFIHGLEKPAHIVIPSVTARGIFNMTAATVSDIAREKS